MLAVPVQNNRESVLLLWGETMTSKQLVAEFISSIERRDDIKKILFNALFGRQDLIMNYCILKEEIIRP
jgi:hypothetical protein